MEIILQPGAVDDLRYWKHSGNKKIQLRIQELLQSIQNSPFEGIGKPEPLKYQLSEMWSRRITKEHRIIYEVKEAEVHIFSLKDHY